MCSSEGDQKIVETIILMRILKMIVIVTVTVTSYKSYIAITFLVCKNILIFEEVTHD